MLRKALLLGGFAATIPAANWLIGNVGTECIPQGPCLIPVGFGLHAPSGVLMIGLALVLRDFVHREMGAAWAVAAVVAGALLSALFAPPTLAMASGLAFLLSELADTAVYTPLYRKRLVAALVTSGLVGAVVDSAVFLMVAFGNLQFIEGQIVGKLWMSIFAAAVIVAMRLAGRAALTDGERDG